MMKVNDDSCTMYPWWSTPRHTIQERNINALPPDSTINKQKTDNTYLHIGLICISVRGRDSLGHLTHFPYTPLLHNPVRTLQSVSRRKILKLKSHMN